MLINIAWRAVGLPGRQEGGPWFYLLRSSLTSLTALGIVVALLRRIERQGLAAIRMPFDGDAWKTTVIGMLVGGVPICLFVVFATMVGFGSVTLGSVNASSLMMTLLPLLVAGFLLAAWEELVLRGYVLRQLSLGLSPAAAVVITGVLFGLMHGGNPGANWQGVAFTALGGVLMGWLVIRSDSLWLLIGYHFGWNAFASAVFGLELSGFEQDASLFVTTLSGSEWLTGGSYGFEASLPVVVFELVVLAAVLRLSRSVESLSLKPTEERTRMSLAEAMIGEFSHEAVTTRKMLERLPEDKMSWKPHDKSMTLGRLATHLAEIPEWAETIVDNESFDMASGEYQPKEHTTKEAVLKHFDECVEGFKKALSGKPDEHLFQNWKLVAGDKVIVEMPRIACLRAFVMSHGVHHRGQFSVYLRQQDVPLPSIYGPSADEGV